MKKTYKYIGAKSNKTANFNTIHLIAVLTLTLADTMYRG